MQREGLGGGEGGQKARGTAAKWESWMGVCILGGGGTGEKGKLEGLGGFSLFSASEINYFYVCGLLCYR